MFVIFIVGAYVSTLVAVIYFRADMKWIFVEGSFDFWAVQCELYVHATKGIWDLTCVRN